MAYCVAANCKNKSSDGIRVFRFPRDKDRRAQWVQNCRRDRWQPTEHSKLCEHHFEESQFEQNRADGRKLLKWNAIPTIFNVPNPPRSLQCKRKPPKERGELIFEKSIKDEPTEMQMQEADTDETVQNDSADQMTKLQAENMKLKNQMKQLTEKHNAMKSNLSNFLNFDQIRYLERVSDTNPYKWSNKTINHALKVKCAVGNKGYEFLRSAAYPLPSSRTLMRRIEVCKFAQGIQHDIIEWLGIKLQSSSSHGKICVLSLDEMQLRPHVEYDKGLKKYVGFVNSEFSTGDEPTIATHALVCVVRGITLHWKQVVAYALTANSTKPEKLWNFMKSLIQCLHMHGLLVKCITTDMGSNNRSVWALLGIHSIRNQVSCKIAHPCEPEEDIYFVADVPHLLKSIRNCLLAQTINLPDEVVNKMKLNSNAVSLQHVTSLVEQQESGGPVLIPGLTMNVVNPSAFEKMRVPIARKLFSQKMSSALLFCISVGTLPSDAVATSWFIEQIAKWYDSMTSRCKSDALSNKNMEKVCHLREVLHWFTSLYFSDRRIWKPIQTGVQLSTTSTLELYAELTQRGIIEYLLTSRLSTDCVENFFSQVRETGDTNPTPVKLRQVIRMISIAQYSHVPKSSSYDVDDDEYYLQFFSCRNPVAAEDSQFDCEYPKDVSLNVIQMSGLYYLTGWVVHKLTRVTKKITCEVCISSICASEASASLPHEWVTAVSQGNLIHPTEKAWNICYLAEIIFQKHSTDFVTKDNVKENLLKLILKNCKETFDVSCMHNIIEALISMFLSVRLHILADDINKKQEVRKLYGSKSAFMRTSADTYFAKS